MKSIIRNFIYVFRRFKTATILNIVGLSVAFAAFMIIMMQVNYDYDYDKFHKDSDRIYKVVVKKENGLQENFPRPFGEELFKIPQIQDETIDLSHVRNQTFIVQEDNNKKGFKENLKDVHLSYIRFFGYQLLAGSESSYNKPNSVLISESLAKKLFGNIDVINKKLGTIVETLDESDKIIESNVFYQIGGVYKDFPENSSVKNYIYRFIPNDLDINTWNDQFNYSFYVKIKNEEDIQQIEKTFANVLTLNGHDEWINNGELQFIPLPKLYFIKEKGKKEAVIILSAIGLFILIIAAVNYTNFSMAIIPLRTKNILTKRVLGASGFELKVSMFVETISICLLSFFMSVILVYLLSHTSVNELIAADMGLYNNLKVIIITFVISIITGLISALYPSYYITTFQPAMVLNSSFALSAKNRTIRNILIGFQFFISSILIISAVFMSIQNKTIQNFYLGFEKENIIVTDLNKNIRENVDAFTNELKSFPGISNVTYSNTLLSSSDFHMGWRREYKNEVINFQSIPVDPSFLKVMDIEITDGRDFRETDKMTRNGKIIFNETARKLYNIELNSLVDSMEVIGFIPDIQFTTIRKGAEPMALCVRGSKSSLSSSNYAYIRLSEKNDLKEVFQHIQTSLGKIDPVEPFNVRFFDEVLNRVYENEQNRLF